jgi:hypothetical protein
MTIDEREGLAMMLDAILGFEPDWERHLAYWGDDARGFCTDVAEMTVFASTLIAEGRQSELEGLFACVEQLLEHGTPVVRDAVGTCFVESLANRVPDLFSEATLNSVLGPRALAVARDWNST